MPVFAGSSSCRRLMNHQIAKSTIMTMRMIAHIGKPLERGSGGGVGTLLAAELAVELAAVAALETVDVAV